MQIPYIKIQKRVDLNNYTSMLKEINKNWQKADTSMNIALHDYVRICGFMVRSLV